MIKLKELKFGDKVYVVKEDNHVFAQKRITMIDTDGIEWYRYDRDRFTYEIEEITYCGKVTFIARGDVRFDEDKQTEYHFKHSDGQIYPEYDETDIFDIDRKKWFYSREEAEARIEQLKLDRGR
jgi:hypothetical protein